jgi:tetratricopeptide (TPR) repeat protein
MQRCRPGPRLRRSLVVWMAGVALASSATASAQIELGVVQGIVRDEGGQPLADVTIRLRDAERGRDVEIETGRDGRFYRRGLRAIEYEITVEKPGYQAIHDKVTLSAGVERRLEFKLAKAAPEGSVEFAAGVEAFNAGNFQGAARSFEAALQKAPDLPEGHVNLALAYLRLSRTADAVAQLEKAAALNPREPRVLFQLGSAYIDSKDLDKAAASLQEGLKQVSGLSDPLAFDATVTLGAVHFARGDTDQAMAAFEKALAARPDAVAPKLGLGKVSFSKGDVERALRLFREVVAASPGSPEAAEAQAFIKELEKTKPPA